MSSTRRMKQAWTDQSSSSFPPRREFDGHAYDVDLSTEISGITDDVSSSDNRISSSLVSTPNEVHEDSTSSDHEHATGYNYPSLAGAIAPRCSTRSSSKSILKSKTKDFTINQLHYNRVQLHGRETELQQLVKAFHDATKHHQKQLVVLAGEDIGSGVTYLTKRFHEHVKHPCFYMDGKYDLQAQHNVPYAGFALACEHLYASLLDFKVESIPDEEDDRNASSRQRSQFVFSYHDLLSKVRKDLDAEEKRVLVQNLPSIQELLIEPTPAAAVHSNVNKVTKGNKDLGDDNCKDENQDENGVSSTLTSDSTMRFDRQSTAEQGFSQQKVQFHQAFQKLLRTMAGFAPIVLVLDDFQYADTASLELLKDILTDHQNEHGLTVIVAYQENLVAPDHPLRDVLRDLHQLQDATCSTASDDDDNATNSSSKQNNTTVVTQIPIPNLTVRAIQGILNDLMSEDDWESPRMIELAEVVHRKTLGNPLFAIQLLKSLADAEVLEFRFERFSWDWDMEVIRKRTNVTENVLDLMVQKLRILPNHISRTLPMVASLGFSFPLKALQIVLDFDLEHHQNTQKDDDKTKETTTADADSSSSKTLAWDEYANECIEQGILETFGDGWYQWTHDKLVEAAVSLAKPQELDKLQFMIGLKLLDNFTPDDLDRNLFVVASLLNSGATSAACKESGLTSPERNLQIAQLNMRAGKKAISSSLFHRCVTYLNQGIARLPEDHWTSHYQLSLELFSVAAQAEYTIGDFESMQQHCDAVISQDDKPLLDKRRVYNAMMDSMAAQDRMGDAAKLCVEVLAKLGCRFPRYGTPIYTIGGLIGTILAKKKRGSGMIGQYKKMTDPSKIWAMNLLDQLFTFWYQDKNPNVPLAILKSQSWTIKYGVCDVSMPNFASVGFMLGAFLGDYEGGEIYAKHALELLKQSGSEAIKARTLLVAYGSNLHWRIPFNDCVKPMLEGYNVGMKVGDVESGLYCILFYLWFSLLLGTPLTFLALDLDTYSKQMMKFQQKKHLFWTQITLQVVLNLVGSRGNKNKFRIVGEVMDEGNLLGLRDDIHILKPALHLLQIYVMFYFSEYERIVEIIESHEEGYFEKSIPGISMLMMNAFQSAIACIQVARKSGKSKHKKMAKKFKSKIDGWVKKGNPNVIHLQSAVDAAWLALSGEKKKHEALAKFEVAVLMSGRRGLRHDQAVAHALCSDFYFSLGNSSDGIHHAEMAVKLFEEWGARAVAGMKLCEECRWKVDAMVNHLTHNFKLPDFAAQLRERRKLFSLPTDIPG